MNVVDLLELQRLRSERRLLESANVHMHREYERAQEEIRRLRDEIAQATSILRQTLDDADATSRVETSPSGSIKPKQEQGPTRGLPIRRRSRNDVPLDAS